jgi:hypothetical protein
MIAQYFQLGPICFFFFFFFWRNSPTRARVASFLRFLDHTQRHITVDRISLDEGSARRRDLYLTTRQSQQTDIQAPSGVETRNFSDWLAADPRLRPLGHWDRPLFIYLFCVALCSSEYIASNVMMFRESYSGKAVEASSRGLLKHWVFSA